MKPITPAGVLIVLFFCLMPAFGKADCPEYTFVKIADSATPVPGGSGDSFDALSLSLPALNSLMVAFRAEGGGVDGVFAGDGATLEPVVTVGEPVPGGGAITTLISDFAFGEGVLDIIALASSGLRGIYSADSTGLNKIVQFGEPAPPGGTFSTIFFVSRHGANLAFQANITGGPGVAGVFTRIAGATELVADTATPMPGSAPTEFGSFSDPDISGRNVAFWGGFGPLSGVYARIDGALTKIADTNDFVPGGTQLFASFSIPVISGRQVFFRGVGNGSGIYVGDGGALGVIAQTGDPAPGGSTFSGFGQFVSADSGELAFSASGSGFNGLFVSGSDGLCRVIDTDTPLEGKDVIQLFMGRDSYATGKLGFLAVFSDGSRGIYLAKKLRIVSAPNKIPVGAIFLLLDNPNE
jgi:hypothetical protein